MIAFSQILDRCHLMGRIDPGGTAGPVLHYAGSYLIARFRGATLRVTVSDEGGWNENANDLGMVIDGDLTIHPLRERSIPAGSGGCLPSWGARSGNLQAARPR